MLHVDFSDAVGVDAQLREVGGGFGPGVFFAELFVGEIAQGDISDFDLATMPAQQVAAVGEVGAEQRLSLLASPAAGISGGEDAGDAPGPGECMGQRAQVLRGCGY